MEDIVNYMDPYRRMTQKEIRLEQRPWVTQAVNFHNANIYTIVPSGSNSFVLCPWMYLVFVLSTVLPSTCSLTNSDFMSCLEVIKG